MKNKYSNINLLKQHENLGENELFYFHIGNVYNNMNEDIDDRNAIIKAKHYVQ